MCIRDRHCADGFRSADTNTLISLSRRLSWSCTDWLFSDKKYFVFRSWKLCIYASLYILAVFSPSIYFSVQRWSWSKSCCRLRASCESNCDKWRILSNCLQMTQKYGQRSMTIFVHIFVSSANSLTEFFIQSGRSFTYRRKSSGPRTDPWSSTNYFDPTGWITFDNYHLPII